MVELNIQIVVGTEKPWLEGMFGARNVMALDYAHLDFEASEIKS